MLPKRSPAQPGYGPAPGVAKLNANETPYGPSPLAIRKMYDAARLGAYYVGDSVKMAQRNVLIRGIYGDYTNWSRVSMGKIEAVKMYVDALPAVLADMNA